MLLSRSLLALQPRCWLVSIESADVLLTESRSIFSWLLRFTRSPTAYSSRCTTTTEPTNAYHYGCAALGALLQLSSWTMLLFTTVLVFHLACLTILIEINPVILIGVTYRVLILTLSGQETEKTVKAKRQAWCLEISYILIPILVPLSFLWIPFANDAYGLADTWCWIRSKDYFCKKNVPGLIEWYALFVCPVIVLCVLNLIIIVAIVVILCKRLCIEGTSDRVYRNMLRENAPLLMYPVMYNFFLLFAIAHRLYETMTDSKTNDNQVLHVLSIMHSVSSPTRGLFFALTYCLFIVIERRHAAAAAGTRRCASREKDPLLRSEFRVLESTS